MRRFTLAHFLLAVELALVLFFSLRSAIDFDYGWHIVNGRHVFDGRIFGGRDLYSWTATNLWIAHEWVTEAVMSVVHDYLGATANSVIAGLVGLATYSIVGLRLRRFEFRWRVVLIVLPIVFVGAMRSLGVRPLMLELLYFSLLLLAIDSYLSGRLKRRTGLILTVVAGIVWANTHGSFILLPAVLGITGAELLISRDERWRHFVIAAAAGALAALLNPWGFRIFEFATQSVGSEPTLAYIDEWKRPVLTEALAIPLLLQILLALFGIIARGRSRQSRRAEPPLFTGGIRTLAFAYLAITSGRHIMLFGIAAAELIASGVAGLLKPAAASWDDRGSYDRGKSIVNAVSAALVVLSVLFVGWKEISPAAQQAAMSSRYPVGLESRLKSTLRPSDRMLNEYSWGGYLILNGIVPVFIDGRSELYGDAQLERYASIVHLETGWQDTIKSLAVTRILMPKKSRLAQALPQNGWMAIAQDSVGVLFAPKQAQHGSAAEAQR